MLRRRLDAEDALPGLRHVHIDFKDTALGPEQLHHRRHQRLKRLARPAASLPEKDVLRHLLADGRGAAPRAFVHRGPDRLHVKAPVFAEIRVLRGHDRTRHFRRHILDRDPDPVDAALPPAFGDQVGRQARVDEDAKDHQQQEQRHQRDRPAPRPAQEPAQARPGHWPFGRRLAGFRRFAPGAARLSHLRTLAMCHPAGSSHAAPVPRIAARRTRASDRVAQ